MAVFVSITNNANKPAVGCVFRSVAVAGDATIIHYDQSDNFTVTGSADSRIDYRWTRDRLDLSHHRDVRQRPVDQSGRDLLSDVFAPARHQQLRRATLSRCGVRWAWCPSSVMTTSWTLAMGRDFVRAALVCAPQPQQPDLTYHQTLIGWRGR